jgi:hypothetical protein
VSTESLPHQISLMLRRLRFLRGAWLAGTLTDERLEQAVEDPTDIPLGRFPTLGLMRRAYGRRASVTAYDACYVALAEALDWPLCTLAWDSVCVPGYARVVLQPGSACPVAEPGARSQRLRPWSRLDRLVGLSRWFDDLDEWPGRLTRARQRSA